MDIENKITKSKNVLVAMPYHMESVEIENLKDFFCGTIETSLSDIKSSDYLKVYVCGDLKGIKNPDFKILVIEEFSCNYDHLKNIQLIDLGKVPLVIHGAGVYFKNLFDDHNYFHTIQSQHDFQELTESTKQSKALRKGIYLTKVTKELTDEKNEILHFHLLRCSSNLTGATDNFRRPDHEIIDKLNKAIETTFEEAAELNHVLAQIYENKKTEAKKEIKAKIKAHSDKTKDMPKQGLIAFCTFYNNEQTQHLKPSKADKYDRVYKETSGLTRLRFKLKDSVKDDTLVKEFSIILYPNSAFIIPLSTNRLYTHEIKPSMLNVDKIPTRMGYVARCSNLKAQYINDHVYIEEDGELLRLEPMTEETMEDLRTAYYKENVTEEVVEYNKIRFSMNSGDYKKPIF